MKRFDPHAPVIPSAQPMIAQRKSPQPPGATGFPVTLSENPRKDGLELRFPTKPADDILADLKAHGWRWSRFNTCWYHKNTPEHRQYAERFLKAPGVPVVVPSVAPIATSVAPNAPIVAPSAPIVPQTESPVPPSTLDSQPSNILPVQFGPESSFPVTPLPTPAWKRAFLRR